jgi:hypothetical protein
MSKNQDDKTLLREDYHALILRYQSTIRIIALQFIARGAFPPSDLNDIIQMVNDGLLAREEVIQKTYNARTKVATYLSMIIRNLCKRFREEMNLEPRAHQDLDPADPNPEVVLNQVAISQAIDALREVLQLMPNELPRLMILLPLHFKLPLSRETVRQAYPQCQSEAVETVLKVLGGKISLMSEAEIYSHVAPFLNALEGGSTSADGFRHWLAERILSITSLLNIRLRGACFNRETLGILIEKMSLQNSSAK